MPFNKKGNSRDGKSNHGGKPSFGKRTEGSANRDSRFDDRKPHSKRSDQASGRGFDSKKSDDSLTRSFNKPTSSSASFQKKDDRPFNRDDRSFKKDDRSSRKDDRPFTREDGTKSEYKSYKKPEYKKDDRYKKADHFRKSDSLDKDQRPRKDSSFRKDDRPFKKDDSFKKEDRPFRKPGEFKRDERSGTNDRPRRDTPFKKDEGFKKREDRPFRKPTDFKRDEPQKTDERPRRESSFKGDRPFKKDDSFKREDKPFRKDSSDRPRKPRQTEGFEKERRSYVPGEPELIRLNRYIANAGICSRRKADELIEAGVVSVNGEVVTSLGTRVNPATDEVKYNGERLKREKMVYVLLNKPKDYITTTDDPQERRTVMHLVEKATRERIYPIGRLDRNTTGLLLMTNDGELAEKLSHPRNSITKIYQVELNKNLTQGDFNKIEYGLELEDGFIKPDDVSYVQGASKKEIGIQIHSGKNRIVRRIFEHLGYDVIKLDRVIYANLTKKDLPRGRWRHLEEKEIIQLKHLIK